jgi:hypothetical protein
MKDGSLKTIKRTETCLGKGGQAFVYLASAEKEKGKEYAIKIYDALWYDDEKYKAFCLKSFEQEMALLYKIESPVVV